MEAVEAKAVPAAGAGMGGVAELAAAAAVALPALPPAMLPPGFKERRTCSSKSPRRTDSSAMSVSSHRTPMTAWT